MEYRKARKDPVSCDGKEFHMKSVKGCCLKSPNKYREEHGYLESENSI